MLPQPTTMLLLLCLAFAPAGAFVPVSGRGLYVRPHSPVGLRPPTPTPSTTAVWVRSPGPRKPAPEDVDPRLASDRQQVQEEVSRSPPGVGGPYPVFPKGPNLELAAKSAITAMMLGGLGLVIGFFAGLSPLSAITLDIKDFFIGALLALPLIAVDAYLQQTQEDTASELFALTIFGTKSSLLQVLGVALLITLATGLGEETLFRGVIQQGLSNNLGPWLGLGLGAGIFGLAHKVGPSDVSFITLSGLYMGAAYMLSGGNLTVPIGLHTFYDLVLLVGAYVRARKRIAGGK